MKALVIAVVSFAAAVLVAVSVVLFVRTDGQAVQVARLDRQLRTAQTALSQEATRTDNLSEEMDGLTQPSDPLAAYNDICNQDFTNGTTGVDQTYYFPCTNNAQTIPQPGN